MIRILCLNQAPLSEAQEHYLLGLRVISGETKCFSPHQAFSQKDERLEPHELASKASFLSFGKRPLPEKTLKDLQQEDAFVTMDWPSFEWVDKSPTRDQFHVHIACDLPAKKTLALLVKHPPKKLFAISSFLADKLSRGGLSRSLVEVLYPPLPKEGAPKKATQGFFTIGAVSDLLPQQGLESLIQAFQQNQEFLPQARLILVGDGPEKKRLLWLVDQLHLRSRIQLVSKQADYHRFLPNLDVFVAANLHPQPWNEALAHALNLGIPSVASTIGCHEEMIEQGKTGLLFEPGNSSVLGQHLINLYSHADWMAHYQKSGPMWVADHASQEVFTKIWLSV